MNCAHHTLHHSARIGVVTHGKFAALIRISETNAMFFTTLLIVHVRDITTLLISV